MVITSNPKLDLKDIEENVMLEKEVGVFRIGQSDSKFLYTIDFGTHIIFATEPINGWSGISTENSLEFPDLPHWIKKYTLEDEKPKQKFSRRFSITLPSKNFLRKSKVFKLIGREKWL